MFRRAALSRFGATLGAAVLVAVGLVAVAPGASAIALSSASPVGGPVPNIVYPSRTGGATTALVVNATEAWSRPGAGPKVAFIGTATAWSREAQVLLVLGSQQVGEQEWIRVLIPFRPDGSTGWISVQDVVLSHDTTWINIDKRARMVSVYRRGRFARRFRAVIGKPATPTPDGLAAVYERDRQPDPEGFLGPWALPLTVFSRVLDNFGGGPGRIAIHGRGGLSLEDPLGSARSHGCIRVDNADIDWLAAHAPQGTPVMISG